MKGARKGGLGLKKEKGRGERERSFNHFFYDTLPPTSEIIRFRLSNW